MTDIYLRSSGRHRRRLLVVLGIALAVGIALLWRFRAHDTPADAADTPASNPAAPADVTAPPSNEASRSLQALRALVDDGKLGQARQAAFRRLETLEAPLARRRLERLLGDLHTRMVFSRFPMEEKVVHRVRAGDTLGKLAQQHGTSVDSIAAINGLEGNLIRVGDRLHILTGAFACEVDKTANEMVVTLNDRFFKRYLVGTGADSSTPEGDYVITLRIRHPVWYRPDGQTIPFGDPENLLGTHYLKLDVPGIGLHGTWEPESVGSQSSAGCVRLVNDDIEELFHLLPEGTPVRITD